MMTQTLNALNISSSPGEGSLAKQASTRKQGGSQNTGIGHVGLRATNPAASAEFYRDVFGMEIVGESTPVHPLGATAFLSSRPDEESHEIALIADPAFAHVAFKVSSLAELRSFHARVVRKNIPIKFAFNHRVSFAFYFDDPDGNMIEVYWPTGDLSQRQPYAEPLDLSQPDEVLLESHDPSSWRFAKRNSADRTGSGGFAVSRAGEAYDATPEQIRKCSEGGHMFARIVQITAKPFQGPNLSEHTRDRTINVLKQQPGFMDMLVVKSDTDPNQFVGISLWKSKEEAEKFLASQQWQQLLQEFRPLVQGEPIIRTFNVEASTMHNVGITRVAQEKSSASRKIATATAVIGNCAHG